MRRLLYVARDGARPDERRGRLTLKREVHRYVLARLHGHRDGRRTETGCGDDNAISPRRDAGDSKAAGVIRREPAIRYTGGAVGDRYRRAAHRFQTRTPIDVAENATVNHARLDRSNWAE